MDDAKTAVLLLEDGATFSGKVFGAPVCFAGEVGKYYASLYMISI